MKRRRLFGYLAAAVLGVCGLTVFGGCGSSEGTLYSLQEAYENGFLTQEDLLSIAYYHNGGREYNEELMAEDFEPVAKSPEALSEETEQAIKECAAAELIGKELEIEGVSAEGFTVYDYYGTYRGYVAVRMNNSYEDASDWIDGSVTEVGGVSFYYAGSSYITLWKE